MSQRPSPPTTRCVCGGHIATRSVSHHRSCPDFTEEDRRWCVAQWIELDPIVDGVRLIGTTRRMTISGIEIVEASPTGNGRANGRFYMDRR